MLAEVEESPLVTQELSEEVSYRDVTHKKIYVNVGEVENSVFPSSTRERRRIMKEMRNYLW